MKVLFFYQHFWPDSPPYANMLRVIGKNLVDFKHDVSVVTGHPSYKASDNQLDVQDHELIDGIVVNRVHKLPLSSRFKFVKIIAKLLFPMRALINTWLSVKRGSDRPDVVIAATIPPVVNGLFAWLTAKTLGAKFVYHFQDIYPEIGVSGQLWSQSSFKYKVLLALDTFVAKKADRCIVLSDDMARTLIDRSICAASITVINNFMLDAFTESDNSVLELSIEQTRSLKAAKNNIIFAGNLGRFQSLDLILNGFIEYNKQHSDIALHFLGTGAVEDQLKKMSQGHSNIFFHPHLPFHDAAAFISNCDAGIVSVSEGIYRYAYPSKTLTYLGLGIPLYAMIEKESALARDITDKRLGVVVGDRDIQSVSNGFRSMQRYLVKHASDTSLVTSYFESECSTKEVMLKWNRMLIELHSLNSRVEEITNG